MLSNHCRLPKLCLKGEKDFRGVYSTADIEEDEIILHVALPCLMTTKAAKHSVIGKKIMQTHDTDLHGDLLAAFMLQEQHDPHSFWKPYLDSLLSKFIGNPCFFSEYYLDFLQGSQALKMIYLRHRARRNDYKKLCKTVPEFSQFSFDAYNYIKTAIITRVYSIEIKGVETQAMVPLGDMFNHRRPSDNRCCFSDASNGFDVSASKRQNSDVEMFLSYGGKCNSRFFVNYGFMVENNKANLASVEVFLSKQDPQFEQKKTLLADKAQSTFRLSIECHQEFYHCLQFLRVSTMDLSTQSLNNKKDEIDLENEISALSKFILCCEASLHNFASSLQEDRSMLRNKYHVYNRDGDIKNAILMRAGEKEVLHYWIDTATSYRDLLETPQETLESILLRETNHHSKLAAYLQSVFFIQASKSDASEEKLNQVYTPPRAGETVFQHSTQ